MKYRVLREGLSQKEDGVIVERSVGDLIEVSDEAAESLLAEGFIGSPHTRKIPAESSPPVRARPPARRR